ncbi:MAG: hypothetical protein J6L91_02875 [Clostridia bacterium]|nr:hypothetical protein [Clostridia bacterium]
MIKYDIKDMPLSVHGAPFWKEEKTLRRLPRELMEELPHLSFFGRRCPGARVRFKTDSKNIRIRFEFEKADPDAGMSMFACLAANVLIGDEKYGEFLGIICPPHCGETVADGILEKSGNMDSVTIHLPRNEVIKSFEIYIDEGAQILPPDPYKYEKPVVFYGSSITEGGCCCNIINAYASILSRHLSFDYINLGFSGNAKGEPQMAEFIKGLDMSVFVYDYDHNAYSPELLKATHEPFFKVIRKANPDLPVIMMTRPKNNYTQEEKQRREIVKSTYLNAVESGDKNVCFIDGETFFGKADGNSCLIDGLHPNDLGFHRMAEKIEPLLKEILER